MFDNVSRIATVILGRIVTPFEIAMILHCVKLARISVDIKEPDNYVDGVNYMAFAAQFAGIERSSAEDDEIAALARKFAPVPQPSGNGQIDQPE
jgi:hypothetical protein